MQLLSVEWNEKFSVKVVKSFRTSSLIECTKPGSLFLMNLRNGVGEVIFEDSFFPSNAIDANSWKGPLSRNIHNESFRLPLPVKIHFRVWWNRWRTVLTGRKIIYIAIHLSSHSALLPNHRQNAKDESFPRWLIGQQSIIGAKNVSARPL